MACSSDSETNLICFLPVTGLVAHPATTAATRKNEVIIRTIFSFFDYNFNDYTKQYKHITAIRWGEV
jgi:hypothetical protein